MARKKEKIVVDLDLPKDDTTLTKLYIILFFSIILGLVETSKLTKSPLIEHIFFASMSLMCLLSSLK